MPGPRTGNVPSPTLGDPASVFQIAPLMESDFDGSHIPSVAAEATVING